MKKKLRIRWEKSWGGDYGNYKAAYFFSLTQGLHIGGIIRCEDGTFHAESELLGKDTKFCETQKQARLWVESKAEKWHGRVYR